MHTNNSPIQKNLDAQKSFFVMLPSEMIAWECGSCTFTNKGSESGPCLMCLTECPRHYGIVACATAKDGGGNCAGPPVAQAPMLAAVLPAPTNVAKAPAPTAEVGGPAPTCKWKTKKAMKAVVTAGVVSAPTPAEVFPAPALTAKAPATATAVAAPDPACK